MSDAAQALERLKAGNARFVAGHAEHPRQTADRRKDLTEAQRPFATLLGCADSRVVPNLIFDEGLGDLFTHRVAGNLADETIIASIAYSVEQLSVPLVVVLGHSACGAVQAAADKLEQGEACEDALTRAICPAVKQARELPGDLMTNAVRLNVERTVSKLAARPEFSARCQTAQLVLIGAVYDLASGQVAFLHSGAAS